MARLAIPAARAAALALGAALVAAACRVEVDGAPCRAAGATDDCPGGQACGNDLRCSARALACAATRCAPGAFECTDPTAARRCDPGADPICGRWVGAACSARHPACRIVADPRVLSGPRAPAPTGTPDPPECRFGRLGDALAAAAARAPAGTVEIDAESAGSATFGASTGEAWPLFVASSVTVAGATPAGPAAIRGAAGAPLLVAVEGTVEDVRIDADGATTAVRVTRAGARLVRVGVSGASGAALQIEADPAAAATVEVLGGSYGGSGVGIWIRTGKVSVAADPAHASSAVASENPGSTVVAGNGRDGVVIGGMLSRGLPLSLPAVYAALDRVLVQANGGTGVIIAGLPPQSQVRVERCDIQGNGITNAALYGASLRKAGALLASRASGLGFVFRGNRVWTNAYDQFAIDSSATNWSIAAAACGSDTNVFATCSELFDACANGACAVSIVGGGTVRAGYNAWPESPPYRYATLNDVTEIDAPTYCNGGPGEPLNPCP
jgi:hypothetical protein